VVVDCYNASPPSVRVALDLLEGQAASRRVAVLGTMLELGEESARLHRQILSEALERKLDVVVATGAFAEAAASLRAGPSDHVLTAPSWREAYPALRALLGGHEVVLLKASRGVAMEGILPLLEADFAQDAADAGEGA
jgi:UDP-N-acetylmuramoyl-tripeptide--D-alanyl-D-alanine ligase